MNIQEYCRIHQIELPFDVEPKDIHMDAASLEVLSDSEAEHFWPKTKMRFVQQLLKKFLPQPQGGTFQFLDVGCGNGTMVQSLSKKWKNADCTGIDGYLSALFIARKRSSHARFILMDLLKMSTWKNECTFDAITLLDVIEHLDDPVSLMKNLVPSLKENGILIISVPAFQSLWSERDVFLGHRKRYTRKMLHAELQEAGYEVLHCNYGYSFMFFPVFLLRKILFPFKKLDGQQMEVNELKVIPLINDIFRLNGKFWGLK